MHNTLVLNRCLAAVPHGRTTTGHPAEGGFPGTQSGPGAGGHGDRRHGKSASGGNGGFYPSVFPISGLTDNNGDSCPDHLPKSFGDGYGGCGHSFPADTGHGGGGGGYFGGGTGGGTGASSGGGGGAGCVRVVNTQRRCGCSCACRDRTQVLTHSYTSTYARTHVAARVSAGTSTLTAPW